MTKNTRRDGHPRCVLRRVSAVDPRIGRETLLGPRRQLQCGVKLRVLLHVQLGEIVGSNNCIAIDLDDPQKYGFVASSVLCCASSIKATMVWPAIEVGSSPPVSRIPIEAFCTSVATLGPLQ